MLFTATTVLVFVVIALLAIGIGHFSDRMELYFFGVVILLFMGLFMLSNGVAEKVGETVSLNSTVSGNVTAEERSTVFVYDQNENVWTNGLGLLSVVIAGGLSLTWWRDRKKKAQADLESVDFEQ